jgi:NADPH:quinone reductase
VRAAIVSEFGKPPELGERPDPGDGDGRVVLEVLAAPLNPVDIAVGSGRYFAGHPLLPYVPGCEAVGRVEGRDGLLYAFGDGLGVGRDGALAERAAVRRDTLVPVPSPAEPALAAALGIAGLAGWLPLAWRAPVREADRVLVLGATGTAGIVAVQTARLLGAQRVVAAGRDPGRLERATGMGADATVQIDEGADLAERFREACGEDGPTLIFDPLWGSPAVAALAAAARGARIVQLGQSAGAEASVPSGLVRGKQLDIFGHTNFAVPPEELASEYQRLVRHAIAGEIRLEVEQVPLEEVADAWSRQARGAGVKLVVTP